MFFVRNLQWSVRKLQLPAPNLSDHKCYYGRGWWGLHYYTEL